MTASLVIAYRDMGCPHRRAAFVHVLDWYAGFGEVIVEAGDSDDTFTRARALNAAISRSTGDVIVQADPDSLIPLDTLAAAIKLAATDGLVIPHSEWLYLTSEATRLVLDGLPLEDVTPSQCEVHGSKGSGNVTVFSRHTWEVCGGFDERFGMWGGDDGAFAYAAEAFTQPTRRLDGPMVHLWHPRLPQSVPGSVGFVEQFAILSEYRDALDVKALVRDR
jgi:hypothetical protein